MREFGFFVVFALFLSASSPAQPAGHAPGSLSARLDSASARADDPGRDAETGTRVRLGRGRFARWMYEDVWEMLRGAPSRTTLYALGAGGGLVALSVFDEQVEDRASRWGDRSAMRVAERFGNRTVAPAAAFALFAGSLLTRNERFQDAAFTSFEAILFAGALANALKFAVGRARPPQGDASDFRPFTPGFTSFPSGHSATAFAFLTPWLLYYPGLQTSALVVLAGGTAVSRLAYNVHWMTDVLAGSAIGFATAYFLTRRHQRSTGPVRLELGANAAALVFRF